MLFRAHLDLFPFSFQRKRSNLIEAGHSFLDLCVRLLKGVPVCSPFLPISLFRLITSLEHCVYTVHKCFPVVIMTVSHPGHFCPMHTCRLNMASVHLSLSFRLRWPSYATFLTPYFAPVVRSLLLSFTYRPFNRSLSLLCVKTPWIQCEIKFIGFRKFVLLWMLRGNACYVCLCVSSHFTFLLTMCCYFYFVSLFLSPTFLYYHSYSKRVNTHGCLHHSVFSWRRS